MHSKVALTKGQNRAENIYRSLQLLDGDINLTGKNNVFIKLNLISKDNQLASTHVDSVRALLKFLRERYTGKITLAEGFRWQAQVGLELFGYPALHKEFGVETIDLNLGKWVEADLYDEGLHPMKLRYAQQIVESDYRIAIGPTKTHDCVGVTLSIKNMAMGALAEAGDKRKMHCGYPAQNLNLYLLEKAFPIQLAVNDGFIGMENDGPVRGTAIDWGVAVSSCDPVAADCLTAHLMGFDITETGYLWYCQKLGLGVGDINKMNIVGAKAEDCKLKFKPHSAFEAQKKWRDPAVDKLLGI